ncbi:hypothetical protein [Paucibacter sp. XJ19-41]|uniref:hypothetical protein n=1 Tax=Paucibacter sp. XJ19-41 TaxID=2927824 RepID=UPI002349615B|nr:hypothetical protein [Paucibacter sp. XJ19-41]MDC6166123.1 hypothetical protein [Paucibacter sp. XJ19-41]
MQALGIGMEPRIARGALLWAALAALCITALWFALGWRYGFDLADEGYLWYGAQRVLHGEVPMRDFMAYDIGRYYWLAAAMRLLGDEGILAARLGAVAYQLLGTGLGVYLVLRVVPAAGLGRLALALLTAALLTIWVYPYYKVFDHGTSVMIVALLVLMLGSRRRTAWFSAGLLLGLAAMMGRNHGVYGAVAVGGVLLLLWFKQTDRPGTLRLGLVFAAGVVVGFSPTFWMMAVVPGFQEAFIASILMLLRSGSTNIGLPVPWPWMVDVAQAGGIIGAARILVGLGFVLILLVPLLILARLIAGGQPLQRPANQLLVAAALAGWPYAHYAFSRADLTHLALGIFPLLLASLGAAALRGVRLASVLGAALLAGSMLALSLEQPYLAHRLLSRKLLSASVTGQTLHMYPSVAKRYLACSAALAAYPEAGERFLAVPDMPSLYAIQRSRMPIWEIYSLFPRDTAFEHAELGRLQAAPPRLVLLSDHALDGRPEQRYSRLHPVLYDWITTEFEPVSSASSALDPELTILRPRP